MLYMDTSWLVWLVRKLGSSSGQYQHQGFEKNMILIVNL